VASARSTSTPPQSAILNPPSAIREIPEALSRRVVVEHIRPAVDDGRFPIKRTVGESVHVVADVFADGHDVIAAVVRHASGSGIRDSGFVEVPMTLVAPGTDEWTATFTVTDVGWHGYQIIAWVDRFLTWRRDLRVKAAAGQDVSIELVEGSMLLQEAAERANSDWLLERADELSDATPAADRVAAALDDELAEVMAKHADRSRATASPPRRVWVDRERARFAAWYEMFPRSAGPDPHRSGTFRDACADLARIADLGFDIVYLPPIHPIGISFRKGRNNTLAPSPDDPGSPWAIGSAAGGHTAVEPGLGAIDDFVAFREEAERLGMEIALDLAWQCSPDHPWVKEHPEWFRHRPDGTIKYAENPPKKYQDIYPFDFESEEWRALWQALLDVTLFWIERGVKIFRVDNPHTKTFGFWEWMIEQIHARHPEVLFLSEAFTRPKPMRYLAKAGFTQSYTYFTWRNSKTELVEYLTELTRTDVREYLRPNLFANTPDILHAYLQHGGRPAFEARLLLAATLAASYGIYSGFELCESRAVAPGSEEYYDSEKYQYKKRDWSQAGNIAELICCVNRARHEHRALQFNDTLQFHDTDNASIIAYSKETADETILTIVNLDPHHMQHGFVDLPAFDDVFTVRDLLDDVQYTWHRGRNYVRFDPDIRQGHLLWLPKHRT
jgi:starch synthase (maltosyl-transferring)